MFELFLKYFGPVFMVALFFSIVSISQRKKQKLTSGGLVLEYSWVIKGVAWFCFCTSVGAPIAMYFQEVNGIQEYSVMSYIFAPILPLLLFIYIFYETLYVKFLVKESMIYCESPWRANRVIKIKDIVEVSFSQIFKHYALKTRSGDVLKVYMFMNGVPEFLDLLEQELGIEIERYDD